MSDASCGSPPPPRWRYDLPGFVRLMAGTVAAFGGDWFTKAWAQQVLEAQHPVPVFGEVFRLTLVYNTGTAFRLPVGAPAALAGAAVALWAIVALAVASVEGGGLPGYLWPLGLVVGGGLGNLVDRLIDGAATDFLDVGNCWPAVAVVQRWRHLCRRWSDTPRVDNRTGETNGALTVGAGFGAAGCLMPQCHLDQEPLSVPESARRREPSATDDRDDGTTVRIEKRRVRRLTREGQSS